MIGLNLASETAFVCEVATHLGGLQYVKGNQPDNVNRLTTKFRSDVEYAREYLHDFNHRFILWSPIVIHPQSETTKHNQFADLIAIRRNMWDSHQVGIEMIINEIYLARVNELRNLAGQETAASEYPVFRLLQIFEQLGAHVDKLQSRGIDSMATVEAAF